MFSKYNNQKIKYYLNKILLILLIYICISISKSIAENHKVVKVGILLGFNEISSDNDLKKQIKFK